MRPLLALGALTALSAPASAGLVVENTSFADTNGAGNAQSAMSFTTDSADYRLDRVVAVLGELNIGADLTVTGRIFSDAGGVPGSVVANGTLSQVTLSGFAQTPRDFLPQSGVLSLLADTTYWLVLESLGGINGLLWQRAVSADERSPAPYAWTIGDDHAFFSSPDGWASAASIYTLEVYATADGAGIPSPATIPLLLLGLGVLGQAYRRRSAT